MMWEVLVFVIACVGVGIAALYFGAMAFFDVRNKMKG